MPSHYKNSPVPKQEEIKLGGKKIKMKPDALRNQLNVPKGRKIPMKLLDEIIDKETGQMFNNPFTMKKQKVTELLTDRASLARTLKGLKKK